MGLLPDLAALRTALGAILQPVPRMALTYFVGIDPGLSGAVGFLAFDPNGAPLIEVKDMPTHEITISGSKKRRLDLYQLGAIFMQDSLTLSIRHAVVEEVASMPKQGVASSFAFGFAAGAIQGVLAARRIPMRLVRPSAWKKAMGLTSDKDASRRLASQLFPAFSHLWARKMDDGRAEAVLLAWYGSRLPGLTS